jgi:hypothetical protein
MSTVELHQAVLMTPSDGSNWWVGVTAVDGQGNVGATNAAGPRWIDATPPDIGSAIVEFPGLSQPGNYTFASELPVQWSGLTDSASGVAGVYVGHAPVATSNAYMVATGQVVQLTPSVNHQPVTYRMWAMDVAGNLAAPIEMAVIVLTDGGDFDGDGMVNIDETVSGTDPVSAGSVFQLDQAVVAGGELQLSWPVVAGRSYTLMERASLGSGYAWKVLREYDASEAVDGIIVVPVPSPGGGQHFYCLKVTETP